MELRGLFQYLVNQLKKGQGIELVLLQVLLRSRRGALCKSHGPIYRYFTTIFCYFYTDLDMVL